MNHDKDAAAVDISHIQPSRGDYICPYCCVMMLPRRMDLTTDEYQCPSCGVIQNPLTDQTKHVSRLTPKITEEMTADEDEESNS